MIPMAPTAPDVDSTAPALDPAALGRRHHADGTNDPGRPSGAPTWWLDLTLMLLTAAIAVGFGRLFSGWSFLAALALPALSLQAVTAVTRSVRMPGWIQYPLAVITALSVWAFLNFSSTMWGPFPTPSTFESFGSITQRSFRAFDTLVAPIQPTVGFVAASALGLIICALYADAAAFKGHVPIQAITCHVGVHLFCAIFARGDRQLLSAVLVATAIALHIAVVRSQSIGRARWRHGDRQPGTARSTKLAVVAVLCGAAAVVAPYAAIPLPGKATIDLRKIADDDDDRKVVSPLVSVETQLTNQSDVEMFTVTSDDGPRYWRLTALDQFDGRIWTSRNTFGAEIPRPERSAALEEQVVVQDVSVQGLAGLWLPAGFEAIALDAPFEAGFDRRSATFITNAEAGLLPEDSYRVWSIDPVKFARNADTPPLGIDGETFTEVPIGLDPRLLAIAQQQTIIYDEPIEKLRNLQNTFRTFEYSTDVDYSTESDPMIAFIEARKGFCQQFASTFALMARLLGYPARVAVGFTYGNFDPTTSTYTVRGRHAHAWPEVWLAGLGWIPFEPTPGRGDPSMTQLTGVTGAQDETVVAPSGASGSSGPSGATTSTTPPAPSTTATPRPVDSSDASATAGASLPWPLTVVAVAVSVLAVAVLGFQLRRRSVESRRSFAGLDDDQRIARAWANAVEDLAYFGYSFGPSETAMSFAERVSTDGAIAEARNLSAIVDAASFGPPTSMSKADGDRAVALSTAIADHAEQSLSTKILRRRRYGLKPT